jgi:hypothetical protein
MNSLRNISVWACWTIAVLSIHAASFLAVFWFAAGTAGHASH